MTEIPSIQWFPGHMTRTKRVIEKDIKLVDVVAELLDARIPYSSSNPDLPKLVGNKPRMILLNKSDLADPTTTQAWLRYFEGEGITAVAVDARTGWNIDKFLPAVDRTMKEEKEKWEKKGMGTRPIRLMVAGIPNVGKSSLMNRLSSGKKVKVEDRPGVTRGKQWVRTSHGMEILDTPGILWPKFEDPAVGEKLAFTGAVKDNVVDMETLAMRLLEQLAVLAPEAITMRYKVDNIEGLDGYDLLELIGKKRGMLQAGGVVNMERAALMVIDEFRGGLLGRISLETPVNSAGDQI